jgi:hypothetical protein
MERFAVVGDLHETALALTELRLGHLELVSLAITKAGLLVKLALDLVNVGLVVLFLDGLDIVLQFCGLELFGDKLEAEIGHKLFALCQSVG